VGVEYSKPIKNDICLRNSIARAISNSSDSALLTEGNQVLPQLSRMLSFMHTALTGNFEIVNNEKRPCIFFSECLQYCRERGAL